MTTAIPRRRKSRPGRPPLNTPAAPIFEPTMNSSPFPSYLALTLLLSTLQLQAQPAALVVRTTTPRPASTSEPYVVPGRTEPIESATIFTRATGIVQERRVDIGDAVKAGEVLAVISAPELDRAVEAARAAVEQAVVRAENARILAERATTLFASNATSREETELRTTAAAELQAAVRVVRAELARLEEQQSFNTVRAPFDGVVAARNFDRGDRVRGDSATADGWLYRLVRIDVLRFAVAAAPDLALRLQRDQLAEIGFNEFPGRTFPAKVSRAGQVFDTASGTMRVELTLENQDLALPAGLTGNARFKLNGANGVVLVPTNTLVRRDGSDFVVTVESGKVSFVPVRPGRNLGGQVEVASAGLTAESMVIINPNALLRPGDPVEAKPLDA
jgi:membrane fusion protein, multidrug efflux system